MNWYFEVQGVSKGPFPESEFAQMVQRREVPADSLVWKPGLEEWATVSAINPPWLKNPATAERPQSKRTRPIVSPQKSPPPEDLPIIEAAIPVESANATRAPAQSKLKPQAPTPAAEQTAQPAEKSGLLKRVFGFGGKKKS
jgi:hypothetical protein